jgi:N-acetylmuramoyl-L-alanine amidase
VLEDSSYRRGKGSFASAFASALASALALALAFAFALAGCSGGARGAGADSGGADEAKIAEGRALVAENLGSFAPALPARADALALAQSIEARAVREGGGARATDFHAVAARIVERVWRVEGREQDAREAIDLFASSARDLSTVGACDSALRGARLAGDFARDASVTYAELYRAERRLAAAQARGAGGADECAKSVAQSLASLDAFRPAARVLAAIDEGLAGEGAVIPIDAGVSVVAVAPRITGIEAWPGDESSRVVIALDRPARFRALDEPLPNSRAARTFVELDGVDVGTIARDMTMAGVVTRVRAEATSTGARVVLDLDGRVYRRVFYLPEPYRVIVDIARHPPGVSAHGQARSVTRVAIDPGHGGTDPGAIGPSGVKEKDITLAIARKVAPVLARDGTQVVLTRDDDRFVSLEERTARANAFNADLFVSIHCNAAENHARHGVETYVLDTARDEMAGRIAARENATSQAAGAEIGSILASMRLADQSTRSARLAELLERAALASLRGGYADVSEGGVKTAGFYVLVGARRPGVLFETSYISNPMEEERLASEEYEQRLADGIVNAVKAYREGR